MRKVSAKGVKLVASFEGFRANAYKDIGGVPTIGYGTTYYDNGRKVRLGDTITKAKAEKLLKKQIQQHANGMENYINSDLLTQNQYDALASFHYNLGRNILKDSALLNYLKNGNYDRAKKTLLLYNKVRIGGKLVVSNGLANRRRAEAILFDTPTKSVIQKVSANIIPRKLVVDGILGTSTIKKMQKVLKVSQDGILGKQTIKALQRKLGVIADGILGKQTIKALQKHYGTPTDGIISNPSTMVKAMQRSLNKNKF